MGIIQDELNRRAAEMLEDAQMESEASSQKMAEIIKSLPEDKRKEIYSAMLLNRRNNSPFAWWGRLNSLWRNIIVAILLIILVILVLMNESENGWVILKTLSNF